MYTYEVFIDVAAEEDFENIEVITLTVKANNTKEANKKINSDIEKGLYNDILKDKMFYVWEILESDKLDD